MTDTAANTNPPPEPWLRGTLKDVPAVIRGVLHALQLAQEDVERWCGDLTGVEVNARPTGLPSIAFHIRHISGSVDRLITYAEGRELHDRQLTALSCEADAGAMPHVLLREFSKTMSDASERIRKFIGVDLEQERSVGRRHLPTTLGGLLVHIADHTQRHVGQLVTTTKVIKAGRERTTSPSFR